MPVTYCASLCADIYVIIGSILAHICDLNIVHHGQCGVTGLSPGHRRRALANLAVALANSASVPSAAASAGDALQASHSSQTQILRNQIVCNDDTKKKKHSKKVNKTSHNFKLRGFCNLLESGQQVYISDSQRSLKQVLPFSLSIISS